MDRLLLIIFFFNNRLKRSNSDTNLNIPKSSEKKRILEYSKTFSHWEEKPKKLKLIKYKCTNCDKDIFSITKLQNNIYCNLDCKMSFYFKNEGQENTISDNSTSQP